MKIGFFDIGKLRVSGTGGFVTYSKNLQYGLKELGHDVESICKEKWPFDLNYDLIVMGHSVPKNLADTDDWWMEPVRQAPCPVFVIPHSTVWPKNREPWASEVKEHIDLLLPPQEPVIRRIVEDTPEWNWRQLRHPVVLESSDKEKMTVDWDYVTMSASRLDKRKRVHVLAEVADRIDGEIIFHNDGPEIDDLEEHMKPNCEHLGVTSFDTLVHNWRHSLTTVDFDGKPRTSRNIHDWRQVINYTMLEAMKYGSIPIVDGRYMNNLFEGHAVPAYGKEEIPDAVAEVKNWSESELRARQDKNYKMLREKFDSKVIAEQLVEYAKEIEDLENPNSLNRFM